MMISARRAGLTRTPNDIPPLRHLADALPALISYVGSDERYRFVNRAYAEWFGLPQAEIVGRTMREVLGEAAYRVLQPYIARVLSGETVTFQSCAPYRFGGTRTIEATYVPYCNRQHELRGFYVHVLDISERAQSEERARKALEKAEDANIAKSEFLANMSHEIRTPMNAVMGLATILADTEPLTPRQRECIRTLQLSADALLSLIDDLLDISKIESRTVELQQKPFNVPRTVEEVLHIMRIRAQEKGLAFRWRSRCDCIDKRSFIGDKARLRQVLLNLCNNAIKFTESGSVTVSIECDEDPASDREVVRFIVEDTGIGIAPEKLEQVFEKFVQGDSSINRRYGGTGLGLAISKMLVEMMGGHITVDSTLEHGSRFTVQLPLQVAPPARGTREPEADRDSEPGPGEKDALPRVLLVEDHEPNILVATHYLQHFGFRYDIARNGEQAIGNAQEGNYGLILMDVQMPGMNGFTATERIRAYEAQTNRPPVPIIGMTAHALTGDKENCLKSGMDDYIAKPFDPDRLRELLYHYARAGQRVLEGGDAA